MQLAGANRFDDTVSRYFHAFKRFDSFMKHSGVIIRFEGYFFRIKSNRWRRLSF
jgi:hypothetical protein